MKKLLENITNTLADASLLELGVDVATNKGQRLRHDSETMEELLIEVAFAEAADYDDIHEAIVREHRQGSDSIRPDDCQSGDNDLCFA